MKSDITVVRIGDEDRTEPYAFWMPGGDESCWVLRYGGGHDEPMEYLDDEDVDDETIITSASAALRRVS